MTQEDKDLLLKDPCARLPLENVKTLNDEKSVQETINISSKMKKVQQEVKNKINKIPKQ